MKEIKVVSICNQINSELKNYGLSPKTLQHYLYDAFLPIQRHFNEKGLMFFDKYTLEVFVLALRKQFESGEIGRSKWRPLRRITALMIEFYDTGIIKLDRLPKLNRLILAPFYEKTINGYLELRIQQGMERSTSKTARSLILHFVAYFENNGHQDFKKITATDALDALKNLATRRRSNFDISAIRAFCSYLYTQKLCDTDLSLALQISQPKRKSIREGFKQSELEALLKIPDRTTSVGKRDYAMMLLAAQTGLRAIDITNLKFDNIDWANNEIKICQSKTRKALSLPFEPELGNAIADYLLNGRPKSDLPHIFLTTKHPIKEIKNRSAGCIVARNLDNAGIERSGKFMGFHTFRRTISTKMLQAGVPIETISEVLGHADLGSSKHYVRIDEIGLKKCAITLKSIAVATEGLEYDV